MKITIKAKGKDSENSNDELQNDVQTNEVQVIESEEEIRSKEKQKQIDSLLENFEKRAADSPELVKDKDSYFNSKEFNDLSNGIFDFNKKRRAELEDRVVHLEDIYKQEEKKSKNTIPWRNYIVYLMIITSLSCCITFSKYITQVEGGGTGTVAGFDFQIETPGLEVGANELAFVGLITGSSDIYYEITVQNNSDVSVNASATLTNNNAGAIICDSNGNEIGSTLVGSFPANAAEFVFLVKVPSLTSGEEKSFTLTVAAEQID